MPSKSNEAVTMTSDANLNRASLDSLVLRYLDTVAKHAPDLAAGDASNASTEKNLIDGLGQYLCLAAQAWAELTDDLILSPQLYKLVLKAHEDSRHETRLTDISDIVSLDLEVTKLKHIRNLTQKFSRDVQEIWNAPPK